MTGTMRNKHESDASGRQGRVCPIRAAGPNLSTDAQLLGIDVTERLPLRASPH
jgi:hypothetical protein